MKGGDKVNPLRLDEGDGYAVETGGAATAALRKAMIGKSESGGCG